MQTQNLQIIPKGVKPIIRASQFDVGREFQLKLYDGAVAYTPPAGTTLRLDGVKPDGTVFSYTENLSLSGSTITVTTTTQMTILEGTVQCEIRMTKDNDDIGTINFDLMVEKSPINETTDLSQTEIPALVILTRMQMENAEAWAVGTKDGEPVSPDDPQYENSAKFWAEHAQTSLSGLTDVELTSPADRQFLVYDATEQKWVNGSISASDVNYTNTSSGLEATEVQAAIDEVAAKNQTLTNEVDTIVNELGAKNLLQNTASSATVNGITFTVNSDGSVTVNGTATALSTLSVATNFVTTENVIMSGCPAGGGESNYQLDTVGITPQAADRGEGAIIASGQTITAIRIRIASGYTANNLVFYPMIRLASIEDDTYVPYAMTNKELTEKVTPLAYSNVKGVEFQVTNNRLLISLYTDDSKSNGLRIDFNGTDNVIQLNTIIDGTMTGHNRVSFPVIT